MKKKIDLGQNIAYDLLSNEKLNLEPLSQIKGSIISRKLESHIVLKFFNFNLILQQVKINFLNEED